MNQALVDPNISIDESVTSMNYKWIKDSWVSQNHPTVNETADRSTFFRGNLDTARKTQVRQLARILDEYNSPTSRPQTANLIEGHRDKSLLEPQAASSPKSRGSQLETTHNYSMAAMSAKERSASPSTNTNQTPSWQKHTLHSPRRDPSASGMTNTSSAKHADMIVDNSELFSQVKETTNDNYKPTHISTIEDSHWKPAHMHDSSCRSDVTPSPVRNQQQFYTAKQSSPALSPLTVESLRIASPRLQHSPSVRNYNSDFGFRDTVQDHSLESLKHDQTVNAKHDQTSHFQSQNVTRQSEDAELDHFTNGATRGDWTEDQSDVHSELSRVDSQATSLQHAIASALNNGNAELLRQREAQTQPVTLEEAIAARYRQSRNERSHATVTGMNVVPENVTLDRDTPVKSGLSIGANIYGQPEPVKQGSQLLEAVSNLMVEQSTTAKARTTPRNIPSPRPARSSTIIEPHDTAAPEASVVELINAFDKVTSECSRRGRQIEEMMGEMENQSRDTQIAQQEVVFSEQRAALLEEQLRLQKLELASLRELIVSHQRPSDQDVSNTQKPSTHLADTQLRPEKSEESFHDKVYRWGVETTSETQKILDPVEQAQQLLRKIPSVLERPESRAATHEQTGHSMHQPAGYQTKSTPRIISRSNTPACDGTMDKSVSRGEESRGIIPSLISALECAQDEITRLKARHARPEATDTATRESKLSIPPINAESMPDAKLDHIRPEEKLYARLQLDKIDTMNATAISNILKNILIQLDLPFQNLSTTISEIAVKIHGMDDSHDLLVHEVMKLRKFAENVHATLYLGDHMEGSISSRKCLKDMQTRIDKMSMLVRRRKSDRLEAQQ